MARGSPARGDSPAKHKDRAHIYVSIYRDEELENSKSHHRHSKDNNDEHGHVNDADDDDCPQPDRWTILVEPHKHHMLSLHHSAGIDPLIFFIRHEDQSRSWACRTSRPDQEDEQNLIGKIMIGESKQLASTVGVEELLRARPHLPPDEETSLTKWRCEQWIRGAVRALQEEGLVGEFDLDEFMVFAKGYVKDRQLAMGEGLPPAEVEYSKVATTNRGREPKKSGRGFWLSYPHSAASSPARKPRERHPFGGQESPYGGLM